jgi:hypothetical protein
LPELQLRFILEGELNNILKRVCFDQVFEIVFDSQRLPANDLQLLDDLPTDEEGVLKRVVKAHRNLMNLDKKNSQLYHDITSVIR